MQISGEILVGLVTIIAGLIGNIALSVFLFGRLVERVEALKAREASNYGRLDGDIGRLNAKVDNDVQGRRAVALMQERMARVETVVDMIKTEHRPGVAA